jgi:hypothetical protein
MSTPLALDVSAGFINANVPTYSTMPRAFFGAS